MSNSTFSTVIENSREQILSSDLNRMQNLASRELQNVLQNGGKRDAFTDTFGNPQGPDNYADPVTRADDLGTIVGTTGSYNVVLSAGQVFGVVATANPDASAYSVARWPLTTITSIAPDGAANRIDLIIATPAMVATDSYSRNILVDATARTVAPASVNKTTNPTATITVLVGTPGASAAPACPSGSFPLWEVFTAAADADSLAYRFIPRTWKRVQDLGTCHAVLQNCVPESLLTKVEASAMQPFLRGAAVHRAVIDGEIVVASIPDSAMAIVCEPDTTTNKNPETATIDTNKDVPAYFYLCGGRNAPQNGLPVTASPPTGLSQAPSALRLVASLTAPVNGRAGADLAIDSVVVPRAGTIYVGACFISRGTHLYKPFTIDGDWIYAATASTGATVMPVAGFNAPGPVTGASGAVDIYPPVGSTMADIVMYGIDTGSAAAVYLYPGATYVDVDFSVARLFIPTTSLNAMSRARVAVPSGGHFNWAGGTATPTSLRIFATGYNMNVSRLG
jgi:hypothetical protein